MQDHPVRLREVATTFASTAGLPREASGIDDAARLDDRQRRGCEHEQNGRCSDARVRPAAPRLHVDALLGGAHMLEFFHLFCFTVLDIGSIRLQHTEAEKECGRVACGGASAHGVHAAFHVLKAKHSIRVQLTNSGATGMPCLH